MAKLLDSRFVSCYFKHGCGIVSRRDGAMQDCVGIVRGVPS
ncbi:MAG: hypothetical protein ACRCTK_01915 [Alphaproteobacteria bacterium]